MNGYHIEGTKECSTIYGSKNEFHKYPELNNAEY